MSHQNYQTGPKELRVEFRTSTNTSEYTQPNVKYIRTEHLSTPPAHHRARNTGQGDLRQFVHQNQPMQNTVKFQLPQGRYGQGQRPRQVINPNQPFLPNPSGNQYAYQQYEQKFSTPPTASFYQDQRRNQDSIASIYEQKKQQYVQRIRRLQDHVEINFPDQGKYIGQVLQSGDLKNKGSVASIKNGQGIFFYPNGDVYFGSWKQQLFDGQGVYMFSTGQIYDGILRDSLKQDRGTYYYEKTTAYYSGQWQNDLKHGTGVLNTPQQYYEGQWKDGVKHGNGYYKNKINHFVYVGEFFQGIKQGKGRMVYPDGSVYAGQFMNEVPHGVGDFEYPNKDKYIGQFNEGKKHGKGNYFFSEGTIFSGKWKEDQKLEGELTLFNGDVFHGCFKNNERYQGQYRYKNGDVYEGTWKDDLKSGFGKLYLQNGERYEGRFVEGQKHGEGIYTWKNGDRYDGQFAYDKRQGLGEYYWSDGGFYKGEWKADRMNGFGRLVKDGVDIIGEFFADHFERPIDQAELGALRNFVLS